MSTFTEDTTRVLRRNRRPDQLGETDADDDLADCGNEESRGLNRGLELAALLAKRQGCNKLAALIRRQKAKE